MSIVKLTYLQLYITTNKINKTTLKTKAYLHLKESKDISENCIANQWFTNNK